MKKFFNDVISILSILCLLFFCSLAIPSRPQTQVPKHINENKVDLSTNQDSAIRFCRKYIQTFNISKNRLKRQLLFEEFSPEIADWAIEYVELTDDVDWKEEALQGAYKYVTNVHWTPVQLHNQLLSDMEGYTEEEARYAVTCIFGEGNSDN